MDSEDAEDPGGDHTESEGLQDGDTYPQHLLDFAVFNAEWIAIEALDSLSLYTSELRKRSRGTTQIAQTSCTHGYVILPPFA